MATYDIDDLAVIPILTQTTDFDYTGDVQFIKLVEGTYKFEVWGAEGGYRNSNTYSGKGGYSVGTITLSEPKIVYIYVGGSGNSGTQSGSIYAGGFNGGGYRYACPGGGGGTDIRLGQDSLYARIIVAGGGGSDGAMSKKGMYGGGTVGGSSTESFTAYSDYCGKGGNTTYSGYSSTYTITEQATSGLTSDNTAYYCGGFGFGGGGVCVNSGYGGAGGGGWYGGSGTVPDGSGDDDRGGGGGSGYVYTSSTASNYPSGCLLNSNYYLTSAGTIDGNTSMPSTSGGTETGHQGNGYARITAIEITGDTSGDSGIKLQKGDIINCGYKGKGENISLPAGQYQLECWGAQGGDYSTTIFGGKGGYSEGVLTLIEPTSVYVYTGGQGEKITAASRATGGGFNGGGNAYTTNFLTCGGGGASDIRIGDSSFYTRVITAGGGGGAGRFVTGGYGGGLTGEDAHDYSSNYLGGNGGTQTAAGTSYYGTTADSTSYFNIADFGNGGSAKTGGYVAGGGGGWYGGGGSRNSGGGGGSGYVYTESTASNYPSGCLLTSDYYLTDASTTGGNQPITEPDGTTATGHSGNGYIRITVLEVSGGINGKVNIGGTWNNISNMYVKVNNVWNSVTGAYIKKNGAWLPV